MLTNLAEPSPEGLDSAEALFNLTGTELGENHSIQKTFCQVKVGQLNGKLNSNQFRLFNF